MNRRIDGQLVPDWLVALSDACVPGSARHRAIAETIRTVAGMGDADKVAEHRVMLDCPACPTCGHTALWWVNLPRELDLFTDPDRTFALDDMHLLPCGHEVGEADRARLVWRDKRVKAGR